MILHRISAHSDRNPIGTAPRTDRVIALSSFFKPILNFQIVGKNFKQFKQEYTFPVSLANWCLLFSFITNTFIYIYIVYHV